jgi:hypothetical protein
VEDDDDEDLFGEREDNFDSGRDKELSGERQISKIKRKEPPLMEVEVEGEGEYEGARQDLASIDRFGSGDLADEVEVEGNVGGVQLGSDNIFGSGDGLDDDEYANRWHVDDDHTNDDDYRGGADDYRGGAEGEELEFAATPPEASSTGIGGDDADADADNYESEVYGDRDTERDHRDEDNNRDGFGWAVTDTSTRVNRRPSVLGQHEHIGGEGDLLLRGAGKRVEERGSEYDHHENNFVEQEGVNEVVQEVEVEVQMDPEEREREIARIEDKLSARDAVMDVGVIETAQKGG